METISPKSTLLVVDDDPLCIQVLGKMLGREYEVLGATSGAEALALSVDHDPELVVLDIIMPGMDGYEVCRRLKTNGKTQDIPVIFMTAAESEESEIKGLTLGADDYLRKTSNPQVLKLRIENMLASRRRLQSCPARIHDGFVPESTPSRDDTAVRYLRGTFSICCACKKIKDETGCWLPFEDFFLQHSDIMFSHGFCTECACGVIAELKQGDS